MKTINHHFLGFHKRPAECLVHIDDSDLECVLICFEDINKGISVTNFSEQLATEIVNIYGFDHTKCLFAEYYGYNGEEYDSITYTWKNDIASNPDWRPMKGNMFWKT